MPSNVDDLLLKLPGDIQWRIYRTYFSSFVVPGIPAHAKHVIGVVENSALARWGLTHKFQDCLSRANIYTKGKLDVTNITAADRQYVYAEVDRRKGRNMQIHVESGKIFITTSSQHWPKRWYNEPQYKSVAVLLIYPNDRYTMRFQYHDFSRDGKEYHIRPEVHEITIAWLPEIPICSKQWRSLRLIFPQWTN